MTIAEQIHTIVSNLPQEQASKIKEYFSESGVEVMLTQDSFYKRKGRLTYVVAFLLFGIFIFGKIGQFPLRWSDAYTLSDDFKANLALNPFQNFFTTTFWIKIV